MKSIMQHGHSTSSSTAQNYGGASGGSSGYTGTGLSSYSGKVEDMEFPYCPDANKYEKLAKIGQGTFGYGIQQYIDLIIRQLVELSFSSLASVHVYGYINLS